MSPIRFLTVPLAPLLLSACAGLPPDWGRGDVRTTLRAHGLTQPDEPTPGAFLAQALATPLDVDRAIQIALLNNPELHARFATLGFAAADVYEAGRLSNPLLSLTRLSAGGDGQAQLSLSVALNFTDLLFLRTRHQSADARFAAEKAVVASAALDLAAEVEVAYRRYAAALQLVQLREVLAQTAQASASLAERYQQAGNLKRGELALEQAAAAQAALQAQSAGLDASLARHALRRLLGLDAKQDQWQLAEALAALPEADPSDESLWTQASQTRLDLTAAREQLRAVQLRLGIAPTESWMGNVYVGADHERDYDGSRHTGPSIGLSLPLLNTGKGQRARAQAALVQAQSQLQALSLDIQRQLDDAQAHLHDSRLRAERYRDVLIPAREAAFESLQREHNYMLIGTFQLLTARQQSFEAYAGYVEALRDYWVARAELARAVGQRLPQPATPLATSLSDTKPAPMHSGDTQP